MNSIRQTSPAGGEALRAPSDLVSLLVELGRVMKARLFYPDGHPALVEAFRRGFGAFKGEINRNGPLELEIRRGGFRLAGSEEPIGRGRLDDLARDFVIRAVRRVQFDALLDAEAFSAFVQVLTLDPEALEKAGGVEKALYSRSCGGITLNQMDYQAFLDRPDGDEEEQEAYADASDLVPPEPLALAAQELAAPSTPELSTDEEEPELAMLLQELEDSSEDRGYGQLATRVQELARSLAEQGHRDEGYRAVLVLAAHAGDDAKRSEQQRQIAVGALTNLAQDGILDDLIRRACEPGAETSIRTAQVLLQLGEPAVLPLLGVIQGEEDPRRRAQLHAILISMGETATGPLLEAVDDADSGRAQVATRLAGEMQNPEAVERIVALLASSDAELRKEAAKALARIGDPTAISALITALDSKVAGVPALAAFCLGATAQKRAVPPLLRSLRRSMAERNLSLARELIRSLGRLGFVEAAAELASILQRRSLLRRRQLRELKLASAVALGQLPGDVAHQALARAAQGRDARLRKSAQEALDRRTRKTTEK